MLELLISFGIPFYEALEIKPGYFYPNFKFGGDAAFLFISLMLEEIL
jgi:hypothetical protein